MRIVKPLGEIDELDSEPEFGAIQEEFFQSLGGHVKEILSCGRQLDSLKPLLEALDPKTSGAMFVRIARKVVAVRDPRKAALEQSAETVSTISISHNIPLAEMAEHDALLLKAQRENFEINSQLQQVNEKNATLQQALGASDELLAVHKALAESLTVSLRDCQQALDETNEHTCMLVENGVRCPTARWGSYPYCGWRHAQIHAKQYELEVDAPLYGDGDENA